MASIIKLNDVLTLSYEVKGDLINFEISSTKLVYAGFGIGSRMNDADMVTVEIIDNTIVFTDRVSNSYELPLADITYESCRDNYKVLNSEINVDSYRVAF